MFALGIMIKPEKAARMALRAMFRRKSSLVPGFVNKLAILFCPLVPSCLLRIMAKKVKINMNWNKQLSWLRLIIKLEFFLFNLNSIHNQVNSFLIICRFSGSNMPYCYQRNAVLLLRGICVRFFAASGVCTCYPQESTRVDSGSVQMQPHTFLL